MSFLEGAKLVIHWSVVAYAAAAIFAGTAVITYRLLGVLDNLIHNRKHKSS